MATLNYTTTVAAAKTVGEITAALVTHKASHVSTSYDDGRPTAIDFTLPTPHGLRDFALTVDVAAVRRVLTDQRHGRNGQTKNTRVQDTVEQAERVAWRVMKDWLLAQLAMVEASLAPMDQVLLPYLRVDAGHTLYQAYAERERSLMELDS